MSVSFLLDEHVEPQVAHRLDAYGYDVESVGRQSGTDLGDEDHDLGAYSIRAERVIVTYDDDFVNVLPPSDFYGVVYFDDTTLSANQVADVLHRMASAYPESEFRGVQYGGREWL